ASLSLDYAKIRKAAIEAKKNEYLYNWVMRTIRNTFIHVDQRFLDMCPNLEPWVAASGTAASGK
ncbi:MAG: peptidylprolyl isomerase, partial [Bacteroidetes bacterium]